MLDAVSFDDASTDHVFTLKRNLLLTWACEFNVGDCVSKSLEAFDNYKSGAR